MLKKIIFFSFFIFIAFINSSDSTASQLQKQCQSPLIDQMKTINAQILPLSQNLISSVSALNAIIYPDSTMQNPFSMACVNGSCPTFNLNSCTGSSTTMYKPFSNCSNGQCAAQCGTSNCTVQNNLSNQYSTYGVPNVSTGYYPTVTANVNNNPITFYSTGCQCATYELTLDEINDAAQVGINYPGSYEIILQCPLCKDFYNANNSVIQAKYDALSFIETQLQNTDIKSALVSILPGIKQTKNCLSSSSKKDPVCSFDPDNFVVLPVKTKTITVPAMYFLNNTSNTPKTYCIFKDQNIQYNLQQITAYLSAIATAIAQVIKNEAQKTQECIQEEESFIKMTFEAKETEVLNNQQSLINLTKSATAEGELAKKLSTANSVLGLGMMAFFILPESAKKALAAPFKKLAAAIKNSYLKTKQKLQAIKESAGEGSKPAELQNLEGAAEVEVNTAAEQVVKDASLKIENAVDYEMGEALNNLFEIAENGEQIVEQAVTNETLGIAELFERAEQEVIATA